MTERIIVGIYVVFFFATIAFLVRRVGAKLNGSPVVRHKSAENPLMAFVERAVLVSYLLLVLNAVFYAFDYKPIALFNEFALPYKDRLRTAGVFFAGVSLALVFTAQFQMGDSWRIGIDDKRDTEIVRRGLFGFFRHPIYLFAIVAGASLFLIVPHAMSLVSLVTVYLALSVQARMEEEFLLRKWGDRYGEFMLRSRRWF